MEFLNIYLLGGLALLGVPIVVHLLMRQKPKRLQFPAFRFLRQRQLVNRRRMRLQHLLLLLLRMAVVAAVCLAIAQPRLFLPRAVAGWFGLGGPRPAATALVFDDSYRMEYRVAGLSRLDDARQRALDLVHDLPADSRVAVLDTGDDSAGDEADDDWMATPAQVRSRINGLRVRPVRVPLVRQIERAAELLGKAGQGAPPSPRRLYVFADRTAAGWDAEAASRIKVPDGVEVVYVDLGVDKPVDLAIEKVEVKPAVAPPGAAVTAHAEVRAVGQDFDAELLCTMDGEQAGSKHVHLSAGKSTSFDFTLKAPTPVRPPGTSDGVYTEPHAVVVKFTAPDGRPFKDDLAHDNVRYATFLVRDDSRRQGRQVLELADDLEDARYWKLALLAYKMHYPAGFTGDLRPSADAEKFKTAKDLEPYSAVCLFETAKPLPAKFWDALEAYVRDGGGLVLVPPFDNADQIKSWNEAADRHHLLPAPLKAVTTVPEKTLVYWEDFSADHPLTRPFAEWKKGVNPDFDKEELRPWVNRHWTVGPIPDGSTVVSSFADAGSPPALVERTVKGGGEGETPGHVLLFTTTFAMRWIDNTSRRWHNFYDSSFGVALINETCKYLAGDSAPENPNFFCGVPVVLPLPASAARGVYGLDAPDPDLTESERSITVGKDDRRLEVRAASAPGQYTLFDPNRNRYTAFSLNVSPDESRLDRLPAEEIEKTLGPGSVVTAAAGVTLNDAMKAHTQSATPADPPAAPVELLPMLMVLTLLFLAFESLLANRFYKRQVPAPSPNALPQGGGEGEVRNPA